MPAGAQTGASHGEAVFGIASRRAPRAGLLWRLGVKPLKRRQSWHNLDCAGRAIKFGRLKKLQRRFGGRGWNKSGTRRALPASVSSDQKPEGQRSWDAKLPAKNKVPNCSRYAARQPDLTRITCPIRLGSPLTPLEPMDGANGSSEPSREEKTPEATRTRVISQLLPEMRAISWSDDRPSPKVPPFCCRVAAPHSASSMGRGGAHQAIGGSHGLHTRWLRSVSQRIGQVCVHGGSDEVFSAP